MSTTPGEEHALSRESRSDVCPKCKDPVKPGSVICINCGHNLKLGINVKTLATAKKAGSIGLAIGVAAAAAVLAGLIWAGIAIATSLEIAWVAVGVGALTGWAAILFTEERSARLGLAAAALAVCGLLVGKTVMANYFYNQGFREMAADPAAIEEYLFWGAINQGEMDAELGAWLEENDPNENEIPEALRAPLLEVVRKDLAAMTPSAKDAVVNLMVDNAMGSVGYTERIADFMSPWDALWFLLAIISAWRIGTGAHGNT
jgi:hypothetical protein